jgi:hypothetical protein
MPETDILNPTAAWEGDIQDSMSPNYGFPRKRTSTKLQKKAIGGTPWTRDTQNTGHVFTLSWLSRSGACVERLKQYYEQYEDGFFTIIDHDGGGRHYVGRFTTEVIPVQTANDTFDVQSVTFEEMPKVPMVEYPSDWDHDSILFNVTNDFGDQKVATNGSWTQATLGATPAVTLGGIARGAGNPLPLSDVVMNNAGATAGDWATYSYHGYGFKLWLVTGPAQGKCDIYIDNVLNTTVDCYSASSAAAAVVLTVESLSLNIHDIQVVVDAAKNASSSGTAIGWYGLQVMR